MAPTARELKDVMLQAGIAPEIVEPIQPNEPLLKQGIDSLDYPAFALAVESKYGVSIGERDSLSLRTLDDFAAYVARNGK